MSKEGKRKSIFKRWWFWLIVVVVIIGISASASGGGSDTTSTTTSKDNTTQKNDDNKKATNDTKKEDKKSNEQVIGVGQPAKIADVTFTVNSVETKDTIDSGNEYIDPAKASGEFVILHVTIKNGKKEAINIMSDYFKIKTNDGTTYEPSSEGDVLMVIPEKEQLFLEQLNPGIQKTGTIVFDVPKGLDLSNAYVQAQTGFWGTETVKIKLK